ncbi:MAG: EamA family transporter [Chitinophagaceae bacterium]|nr:MAG: EamA family transporter [Chitinophagaceae bacterium]
MHKRLLPHLALLSTNLFFAINFSAIKHLMNNDLVKPFGLNVVRVGITTIMLWILFAFKKERSYIKKEDAGRFILCGFTGIALNQLLFLKGLQLTYPIHASLLMLVTPIIIILAAAWLLKERLTSFKITGLVCGLTGAAILIGSRSSGGGATDPVLGDILVVINAASYAAYFILVKPLMTKYPPIMMKGLPELYWH